MWGELRSALVHARMTTGPGEVLLAAYLSPEKHQSIIEFFGEIGKGIHCRIYPKLRQDLEHLLVVFR